MSLARLLRRASLAALFGGVAAAPFAGCSSSDDAPSKVGLAGVCTLNTDCNSPLVCAFGRCHDGCKTTRDCPSGERCVSSERPFSVCQLNAERSCDYNSECPSSQVCAVDGQCREQCTTDRDCIIGQVCRSSACAEPADLVNDQLPIAPHDGGVDAGQDAAPDAPPDTPPDTAKDAGFSCSYSSECLAHDPAFVCRNGLCGYECQGTIDCSGGRSCVGRRCVVTDVPDGAPDGYGSSCVLNSDCPAVNPGDLICKQGVCVYSCNSADDCDAAHGQCCSADHLCVSGTACLDGGADDGGVDASGKPCLGNDDCDDKLYCNGIETCFAGHCAPPLDTPCSSHAACITDTCDETTHACGHHMLGAMDGDGDGHLAFACGGDDCDDTDSTIYTGAKELCDGKDNDCNHLIDDHSRVPFGPTLVSQSQISSGAGAPLGDGWALFGANATLSVQLVDAAGVAGAPKTLESFVSNCPSTVLAAAGEKSSALVLWSGNCTSAVHATVIGPDGSKIVTLTVATGVLLGAESADVAWTGSSYAVASLYSCYVVGNCQTQGGLGQVELIHPDGTTGASFAIPTPETTGNIIANIRVAASATTLAVGFSTLPAAGASTSVRQVITLGTSLSVLGGPTTIGASSSGYPTIGGIGAVPGGFVVVSDGGNLVTREITFVHDDGTLGMTTPLGSSFAGGTGSSDGAGAAFLFATTGPLPVMGYTDGINPLELSPLSIGGLMPKAADRFSIAGSGGRLGLFWFSANDQLIRGTAAGCPP